jgi:hypothetical protein
VAGGAIMRVWCHIPSGDVIIKPVRRLPAPVCCVVREDCNKEGKHFFFEKKKQETFASFTRNGPKFFGSFFQKRTAFFYLSVNLNSIRRFFA